MNCPHTEELKVIDTDMNMACTICEPEYFA